MMRRFLLPAAFLCAATIGAQPSVVMSRAASVLTTTTFAALGTPSNSSVRYCSNCNQGSFPCTGGGTGSFAFRIGSAWVCPSFAAAEVPATRTISTTSPLGGGGDLSADRTFTCTTCATSGNNLSFFSATSSAQLRTLLSDELGTGAALFDGATPTSFVCTNCSGSAASLTAGTATNATNVAVTDDTTTNATMFPLWVTTASGNQAAKVTSTKFTFNPSLGNVGLGGAPSTASNVWLLALASANLIGKIQVQSTDASGTSAGAAFVGLADTASFTLISQGTARTTSRWGAAIGGWNELVVTAGNGLAIGTTGALPVKLGTNGTTALTIDTSQNITAVGSLTTSQTAGIIGTTTNNNANAGSIGEYQTGTTAANTTSLSTGTTVNVGANTNITLTAGDWDCSGVVNFTFGATTSITNLTGGISTTTGTLPAQDSYFDFETSAIIPTGTAVATWVVPDVRLSVSGSTNVFLVSQATFTASTIKVGGTIRCRRMR